MTHKSPISLLQEVCVKRGLTPLYELISNEGPVHEPLFVFKCTVGQWSATAKGMSKKKAKHQAAYTVLMLMFNESATTERENTILRELRQIEMSGELDGDGAGPGGDGVRPEENNPVGQLQELCQRSLWPQPAYDFSVTDGPVHVQEYTCVVTLWKWSFQASGKSKKLAKRRVAMELLQKIVGENLTIPQETLDMMEETSIPMTEKHQIPEMAEEKPASERVNRNVTRATRGIWTKSGKKLPSLTIDLKKPDLDPIQRLEELGEKHGFAAYYSYISKTKSGNTYAMVQVNTHPSHLVRGTGSSLVEARLNGAYEMLVFLKLMSGCQPRYTDYPPSRSFTGEVWQRAAGFKEEESEDDEEAVQTKAIEDFTETSTKSIEDFTETSTKSELTLPVLDEDSVPKEEIETIPDDESALKLTVSTIEKSVDTVVTGVRELDLANTAESRSTRFKGSVNESSVQTRSANGIVAGR